MATYEDGHEDEGLEINKLGDALTYYRRCRDAKTWTPEKAQMLLMSADDSQALLDALAKER